MVDSLAQAVIVLVHVGKLRLLFAGGFMFRDLVTGERKNGIQKPSYSHEAMIDLILANPAIDQNDLASYFGYTPSWVSIVISSDAFQAALGEKREKIIDPILRGAIEESFKGLVIRSIEIVRKKLDGDVAIDTALEVLKTSSKALGYGARPQMNVQVNGNANLIGVLSSLQPPAPARKLERPVELEIKAA
jgi:hypothetical protein